MNHLSHTFNKPVIDQWIRDLATLPFRKVRFNADYSVILDNDVNDPDSEVLVGDAVLFLVLRNFPHFLEDTKALFEYYDSFHTRYNSTNTPDTILSTLTGIPLEDSKKLMWPDILLRNDRLHEMTPLDFIDVLGTYLNEGYVDWTVLDIATPPTNNYEE